MIASKLLMLTLAAAVVSGGAAPLRAQTCAGDCNSDGSVSVAEIVVGVSIALGEVSSAACPAADADGDFAVDINELLAAVRRGLDGCDGSVPQTGTATASASPTPTLTPSVEDAALAAASHVATDPFFRLFDLQESLTAAVVVVARARRTAHDGSGGASGCQQLDCELFGTQEVCGAGSEFTQTFDNCTFADISGQGSLNGLFAISSTSSALCSGTIPRDASFVLRLESFTHDVSSEGNGSFRSFHDFSESYEQAPAECTVSNRDFFGFNVRGSGRRLLHGVLRRFEIDGAGHVVTDIESGFDGLEIQVGATQGAELCTATAALSGGIGVADFRAATQLTANYTDFAIAENPQDDGTLRLQLSGTVDTDCLGAVTLSTVEPVAIARAHRCFSDGQLESHLADATLSARYEDGAVELDLDADGTPDQHFAACTDVPLDQCTTNAVGLCGVCTASNQCQPWLACFDCFESACAGGPKRCAFSDAFVTCEDGRF